MTPQASTTKTRDLTPDPAGYQLDELTIDLASRGVRRAGTVIRLQGLSFDLLVTLVRAAPGLLSFEQLSERVWPGLVVSPETIVQRVKLLRGLLKDDPHAPRYIEAVRGRGYRMIAEVRALTERPGTPSPSLEETKTPSSLSRRVITDLLRGEQGFKGLVMTDDLDMGAILNHYGLDETIRLAIEAGNDLAMICHRVNVVAEAHARLATLPIAELDRALENVARYKAKQTPPDPWDEAEFLRRDMEVRDLRAAVLGEAAADQRSPEDGKRSPVEVY